MAFSGLQSLMRVSLSLIAGSEQNVYRSMRSRKVKPYSLRDCDTVV